MKGKLKNIRLYIIVILPSTFLALFFYFFPLTGTVGELWMYDFRQKWFRKTELNKDLQVIAIDQESLNRYGAFPWKRDIYAKLINTLKNKGPALLVFDILFQEPSREDKIFAKAIKEAPFPIILPYSFEIRDRTGITENLKVVPIVDTLKQYALGIGFIKNVPDADGKTRRAILAIKDGDKYYPSIDLVAFAILKGVPIEKIKYEHKRIQVGKFTIPTDENYMIFINYYFPKGKMKYTFPVKSFYKFLETPEKTLVNSKSILFVGAGAPGMQDEFPTPMEDKTYGAIIHALILDTMLRGNYIKEAPPLVNISVILFLVLLFGFLISRLSNIKYIFLSSSLILMGYSILNFYLFHKGYWLMWVPPFFTIFSCTLIITGIQFFRTHQLFRQFVVPEVADKMITSEEYGKLGGKEKEVTILFTDIRGYTSLSENMSPSEVMEMLNEYHQEMVKVFEKNKGRVFDYMGDAQMVVFGAPVEVKDHPYWAVKSAIEVRHALENLKKKWHLEHKKGFEIGIGICTGKVAVGIVGAEGHKQYTAIGDPTNVASRLQSQSKVLGHSIIISNTTAERVKDKFKLKPLGKVPIRGKKEPMELYTVEVEV